MISRAEVEILRFSGQPTKPKEKTNYNKECLKALVIEAKLYRVIASWKEGLLEKNRLARQSKNGHK